MGQRSAILNPTDNTNSLAISFTTIARTSGFSLRFLQDTHPVHSLGIFRPAKSGAGKVKLNEKQFEACSATLPEKPSDITLQSHQYGIEHLSREEVSKIRVSTILPSKQYKGVRSEVVPSLPGIHGWTSVRAMDREAHCIVQRFIDRHNVETRTTYDDRVGIAKPPTYKRNAADYSSVLPPSSHVRSLRKSTYKPYPSRLFGLLIVCVLLLARGSHAAFISTFTDCLSPNTINSDPKQLQFTPLWVWAFFNTSAASHNLNVTIFGNVSGQATQEDPPKFDDPRWKNPNDTLGKIVDVSKATNLATTLQYQFNVLSYTPYNVPATRFCNTTVQGACPIAPVFAPNA